MSALPPDPLDRDPRLRGHRSTVGPPSRTALGLSLSGRTHRGCVRTINQDAAAAGGWRLLDDVVVDRRLPLGAPVCCAVADGAGGHPAGERASASALAEVMRHEAMSDTADLADGFAAAHARLLREMRGDPSCHGMATTMATLVATGDDVLIANVGDSRIYEIASGGLLQLSVDDRPERPDWAGPGTETSVLTQVLGGFDPTAVPEPHVDRLALEPGLRFLLCSDGLGACLEDDAIADVLSGARSDREAVRALVDAALTAGAPDNVTVLLVRLEWMEAR